MDDAERQRLERLALADWSEAAEARVDSVIKSGRRAAVNLLVNGDYEYSVNFQKDERGQWYEAGSSSGHADRSMLEALDDED
jgi:hypothetical protein